MRQQLTDKENQTLAFLAAGGTPKALALQEGVHVNSIHGRIKKAALVLGVYTDGHYLLQAVVLKWSEQQPRTKARLPETRESTTHKVVVQSQYGDADVFIIAGKYPSGRVGELFVNIGLQGSTLRGTLDAWARMVSISLQWGVPLTDIIEKFKDVAFEPSGPTSNPDIPNCKSIIDYTVRWLELEEETHGR